MGEYTSRWRHAVWPWSCCFTPARVPACVRWHRLTEQHKWAESRIWYAEEHCLNLLGIMRACNENVFFFYYVAERNEREVRLRAVMNELVQLKCGRNVTWASSHRLWKAVSLCRQKVCIRKALYKQAMSGLCGEKLHWFILWFGLRWNFNAFFMLSFW